MTSSHPPPTGQEFDRVAARYDEARPSYPPALYSDLAALTGIRPGARLLEVGSGTGKATTAMARPGCQIVCLEPGASMAAVARARLGHRPGVQIVNTTFEAWDPAGDSFDLIFAGTYGSVTTPPTSTSRCWRRSPTTSRWAHPTGERSTPRSVSASGGGLADR